MKWIDCNNKLPPTRMVNIILKGIINNDNFDIHKVNNISEIYQIAIQYKQCFWLDEKVDDDLVERVKFLDNALCTSLIFITNQNKIPSTQKIKGQK